jgi:hypothetical protein
MLENDDRPELTGNQPTAQELPDANEAARRRLTDDQNKALNCEHSGDVQGEVNAVDRSAEIMEQWETTTNPSVRRVLLESVGREMMNVHEAPPPPVNAREMASNELGAYDDENFRIELNRSLLERNDPKAALETYLHEYRHVEQAYEVQKSHGVGRSSVDTERAAALEHNQAEYISPKAGQGAYEGQAMEVDARKFARTNAQEIVEGGEQLREAGEKDLPVASDADAIARRRVAAENGSAQ